MADEISVTMGLRVVKDNFSFAPGTKTVRFDQTTAGGGNPGTVDIGTSEETIAFGDITPGWCQMTNLDATNYVEVGFSTGVYGIRLLPDKGGALFYVNTGTTVYAKADTATCAVTIHAVDV